MKWVLSCVFSLLPSQALLRVIELPCEVYLPYQRETSFTIKNKHMQEGHNIVD